MPTSIFTVLTWIVASVWDLSMAVMPVVFLSALAYYWERGDADDALALVVTGQRGMVLRYGIYLIAGLVLGGTLHTFVGTGTSFMIGIIIGGLFGVYGLVSEDLPAAAPVEFAAWHDYRALLWLGVPLLAAAALVTQHTVLLNLTALIFYGVIFWEL